MRADNPSRSMAPSPNLGDWVGAPPAIIRQSCVAAGVLREGICRAGWLGFILACALAISLVVPTVALAASLKKPPGSERTSTSFQLALRYEHGEGVLRDPARAIELYCDAASDNDPRAYLNLGWMYAMGRGVPHDDAKAVGWWRKAANMGIPQATNLLQLMRHVSPAADSACDLPRRQKSHLTEQLRELIKRHADREKLDERLVTAVIWVESAFDPRAISPKNAKGLMQLMPVTAVRFGVKDPFDPEQNIQAGTRYLRVLLDHFSGNLTLALAAYNAGEDAVDRYADIPPISETRNYIKKINRLYPIRAASSGRATAANRRD